ARDPAPEPGHASLHPEHGIHRRWWRRRLGRYERIRRREDPDPGLDRDHEADREGGDPLGARSRLGLRGSARRGRRGPREVRSAAALLGRGVRLTRRGAPERAPRVARALPRPRPGDPEGRREGSMTETHPFKEGLEDVVAADSAICYIDGERGILSYGGI